ncbi:MAG TPA: DUF427 domain-containing protein [Acidimicrobiales bacterium]|nr:DUF427 domain-containing protein [Acidimicrobiales bacterium]
MTTTSRGRVRVEPSAKRVRAYLGGEVVVDTTHPLLVWEVPYYPTYYLPVSDVRAELVPTGGTDHSPSRGDGEVLTVRTASSEARDAAVRYAASPLEELRDHVRLDWGAMDAWFEEDEEVFTHVRSPYARIDILPSSREVVVRLGDVELARTVRPHALFETGLPTRWYIPRVDARMDLLTPSATVTHCPYKGTTVHFSARDGDRVVPDVAWSYPTPLPESGRIAGLLAFYDDRVTVTVDGEPIGTA